MGSPSIPDNYDFDHTIGGGLAISTDSNVTATTTVVGNANQPVAMLMTGDPNKPITTQIQGDASKPVASLVTGDRTKPVTTLLIGDASQPVASTVEVLNLPRFSLQDIKDLKNGRVRIPNYNQFCFKVLGIEVFTWCLGGEAQVISEPYVPNAYEKCEIPCCDVDTRPFPENDSTRGH